MTKRLEIFLIRHGSGTHMSTEGLVVGRAPEARLTDEGHEEAKQKGIELAKRGFKADVYASSSIERCIETATSTLSGMGVTDYELEVSDDLIEQDHGAKMVGVPYTIALNEEAQKRRLKEGHDFKLSEEGESVNDVGGRGLAWLEKQTKRNDNAKTFLVFSHGGLISSTVALISKWDVPTFVEHRLNIPPVSETKLVFEDGQWSVEYFARPVEVS